MLFLDVFADVRDYLFFGVLRRGFTYIVVNWTPIVDLENNFG